GKRPGAGRKPGIPTKSKAKMIEVMRESGMLPLEFLLNEMRDESNPRRDRATAAIAAAPYIHSKMPTAIVTPTAPPGPIGPDDESLLHLYNSGLHAEADEE